MQTQDIKRRIRSVKSTQQITRAMKFVAAAKLRRSQERMLAMRPYANAVDGLIRHVAEDLVGDEHPLFSPRLPPRRAAYVLIAGDRGLCGGFNANLFRLMEAYCRERSDLEHVFLAVGKRAIAGLRKSGRRTLVTYHDVFEKLSYVLSGEICDRLIAMFSSPDAAGERIDEAYVVYNEFASMLTQRAVIRKLLPVSLQELRPRQSLEEEEDEAGPGPESRLPDEEPDDIFDIGDIEEELAVRKAEREAMAKPGLGRHIYNLLPDPAQALEKLISRRLATEIHRAMLESYAAELAARMTAMDNATANAEEMVSSLTLDLNRARQAGITLELLDIIGGASA
ncbi:MAG: ATP synthase F1 subunit gamma [Planctomycetota bacterium]|jgi:F-type H+-transporting ATPase subunit gamma|nr:ATP synthase F1 subunit gamma [Planctomycetota bacterium]